MQVEPVGAATRVLLVGGDDLIEVLGERVLNRAHVLLDGLDLLGRNGIEIVEPIELLGELVQRRSESTRKTAEFQRLGIDLILMEFQATRYMLCGFFFFGMRMILQCYGRSDWRRQWSAETQMGVPSESTTYSTPDT